MENQPPVLSRRLSGADAAFLYLERKEIPLSIACVAIFDGPLPFREFVADIDAKLDLIPRYRQVAVPPPYNLGYPTWEFDPNFNIKRHIFRVRLEPPGGQPELEALAGRLLSQVLDRGKPLWEIHVVEGLEDGRGALIVRIHHALADGVAGAAMLRIMFDATPERPQPRKPRARPAVPPRAECTLAEQVSNAIQSALENAVAAEAGLLSLADGLLSERGKTALQELTTLLPELLQPPDRFFFNKPCTGDRKFCWTEADFSQVQAIRAAVGGKVNDCILSVVVRAIARYMRLHGEKVKGRFLRVVCPVNVRGDEHGESLGNRITFLPVVLPLDVSGPVEMLHAVATRMEIMKNVRAAELVSIFASCLGATPAPVQELFWRGLPLVPLPLPLLNVICTNVPGPQTALYSVGRRLLASYPQVPTGYELGLGVAIQSYDGKLFFGVTADAHVAPDAERLRDYIRICFHELAKAAGVENAGAPPATPRARKPRPAKRTEPVETPASAAAAAPETAADRPGGLSHSTPAAGDAEGAAAVQPEPVNGSRARRAPRVRPAKPAEPVETPASAIAAAPEAAAPPAAGDAEGAAAVQPEPVNGSRARRAPRVRPAKPAEPVETPASAIAVVPEAGAPPAAGDAEGAGEEPADRGQAPRVSRGRAVTPPQPVNGSQTRSAPREQAVLEAEPALV
jgi:WS/DGAT/MGAT family acyltransferase